MRRYAAFLRGMNLGGRRLKNEELRRHVEALGFAEVATFRASGNLVLASEEAEPAVRRRLEEGLAEALSYEVPTFVRDGEELLAIAAAEPFDAAALAASKGKPQVAMLGAEPSRKAAGAALALSSDDDRLVLAGRDLFWLPKGGLSETELDLKALERALGPSTVRTMGTVRQIAAKHFGA